MMTSKQKIACHLVLRTFRLFAILNSQKNPERGLAAEPKRSSNTNQGMLFTHGQL